MSQQSRPSNDDDEDLSLALEFQGLQISVRGPLGRALEFVERLSERSSGRASSVTGTESSARPQAAGTPSASRFATPSRRLSLIAQVIFCFWLLLCLPLRQGGPQLDECAERGVQAIGQEQQRQAEFRVQTGLQRLSWATDTTWPFEVLDLNPHHVVLNLFAAVGTLEGSDTICHGFPQAEAQTCRSGRGVSHFLLIMEGAMELMALHAEFGPAGFQVFLLDTAGAQLAVDGVGKAMAFVVMTRRDGLLVAVPELALEDEVLTRGTHANAQDMMGPSTRIDVDAGVLDEDALLQEPSIVPDKLVACVLVDFSSEVVRFMTAVAGKDDLEGVHTFSLEDPWLVPLPDSLVAAAMLWAGGAAETSDRLQFYSADEAPETPSASKQAQGHSRFWGAQRIFRRRAQEAHHRLHWQRVWMRSQMRCQRSPSNYQTSL